MAESRIVVTAGSGESVDTFTLASTGYKRQAVVVGDSSIDGNVAPVRAADPSSSDFGMVVRDVNTSAIVGRLATGIAVSGITGSVNVYIGSTAGTINVYSVASGTVAIAAKDGTMAVYFSPGTPAVSPIGSQANTPFRTNTDGALKIYDIVTGTINTVTTLTGITNTVGVYFDRAGPTVTTLQGGIAIGNAGVVGATTQRVVHASDVVTSMNIMAIGTTNTLGIYMSATAGTLTVDVGKIQGIKQSQGDGTNATGALNILPMAINRAGTHDRFRNDGGVALGAIRVVAATDVAGSINIMQFNGNAALTPTSGIPVVNTSSTMAIFTVTGTTSTAGNNTLVAPSASYNFKVFAYSIQSTGLVSFAPRFTTGASAGATELWRPLINAVQTASAPIGANLAVPPPGFLFATGTNTTLALYLDTGSLMHYSVSYIKESA